jgi:ankyrin repeat protein
MSLRNETMTEPQGNEGESLAPSPGIERAHTTSEQGTRESRLSALERQWSVGSNLGSGIDMNQRSPFQRYEESPFHASWAGTDSFLGASALPLGRGSFSYHSSIGPMSVSTVAADQTVPLSETGKGIFTAIDDKSTVTSIIHDEARIVNWQVVLKLCHSHPQHAKYADPSGWTALHHACNRRCPREDVVEALITAYPDALLDLEEKGMTPLHYACRFKAPKECVRHLLHLFPEKGRASVSKRDRKGRTPLNYAVRYDAPPGVVEMLLEVDPSAVLDEDRNADSPLAIVWDSWAEKFEGKKTLQPLLHPEESGVQHSTPEELWAVLAADSKLKKRWDTVNMLLRASFRFPSDGTEHRKWRVMHATAAIKCHPTLFRLAKALYPEQAKELDEGDLNISHKAPRSALHLAASSPASGDTGSFVLASLLEMNPDAAFMVDDEDGSVPLHLIVQNERKSHWSMVRSLLQRNPAAVRSVDKQGRTPLHRAAAAIANHSGTDWSGATSSLDLQSTIFNLLQAYREAASAADTTGCLPLHLIAAHARIWDEEVDAVSGANEAATRVRAGPVADSSLPLHLAAKNERAELSLIAKLVQLNPRAASQPDSKGKLPFHLACESGKLWEEGVSVIYDAFPDAVRESETNPRRWTALQMAAASRRETGPLIEKLTELNPEAANRQDSKNRFPLHLACAAGKGWETGLRTLFEANPDAIFIEDTCGLLPFHIAAFRYCKPSEQEIEIALKAKGPVFKSRGILRTTVVEKPSTKSSENEAIQIEVMFELLRAAPNILKM